MTGWLRRWWYREWQTWTCLHGWHRIICIADDLAHMLHLPTQRLCDLHDRQLMRTASDENDLHDQTIQRMWNDSSGTAATLGDVKITYRRVP